MVDPANSAIILVLALALVTASGYAVGRLHQRSRDGNARESAYQRGYDEMTRSTFAVIASSAAAKRRRSRFAVVRGRCRVPSARRADRETGTP